jgi:prepilin-type N-terminal cleavage/methylation domain-containing protein
MKSILPRFPRHEGRSVSPKAGFTLIEVMMAAIVMALAISSSIIVLQHGLRAIDTARYTTLAGQVLQSQMEKLRLLNWTQLTSTATGAYGPVMYSTFPIDVAASATAQIDRFVAEGYTGRCAQSIVDAPSPFNATMKEITLTATWKGMDGRMHSLSYITYYGKNGLSDFFYTTHL